MDLKNSLNGIQVDVVRMALTKDMTPASSLSPFNVRMKHPMNKKSPVRTTNGGQGFSLSSLR